ncbi:MAG: PD-(D/E)XK nuclease family protein [Candidatus Eremiobacterota bacterium]
MPLPPLKWTLGERLLHLGQDWVNFRFTTPFELALETAAPTLLARGINPKPEALGPSLLHKLILELPPGVPTYFRSLLEQPGLTEALWKTLCEIRMAGLGVEDLQRCLSGDKRAELCALLRAYEDSLQSNSLADRASVFRHARPGRLVDEDDLVLEFPSVRWKPLERKLLDELPGRKVPPRAVDLQPPRRLRQARETRPGREGDLVFFVAGRRDAEIVEILRRVRSLPLDQVELATPDVGSIPLLRDKLATLGLPVTFEAGLPIGVSRPGQALCGLLAWIEHRYSAFDLRNLLLAELVLPGPGRLEPVAAASYLERCQATWGRATCASSLGSFRTWLLQRAAAAGDEHNESLLYQADMVAELADWVGSLFERLPESVDWGEWVRGLRSILETDVPAPSPPDQAARTRLLRALDELLLLEGHRWPLDDTLRLLRERLTTLEFGTSRALPGHLHVTPLDRVGWSGRRHVFLFGLEEIGSTQCEDPVLTDRERAALHPDLALSSDRAPEAMFDLLERLATADGTITLSYSARDSRTGQEQLPSWLYFHLARTRVPSLKTFEDLAAWLGEPRIYAGTLGETDWWLAAGASEAAVLGIFPYLAAGAEAVAERASDRFTRYDGWVPSAASRFDREPTSASRLEMLAGCPMRYFFEVGLKLRTRVLERPDLNRWLDEAARGRLLHQLFARYHRTLREAGLRPDYDRDHPTLCGILEELVSELRRNFPPLSEAMALHEARGLQRDLEKFLRLEVLTPERVPVGIEVGFGMPDLEDEPLACADPVEVDLEGLSLTLRGRIDRLDRMPDGLEVVDYKTGRRLTRARGAVYRGGRQLQHALYALVAERLAGHLGPIRRSGYFFPSARSEDQRVVHSYPDRAALRRLLMDVTEPLRTGAFVHSDRLDDDCRYCDFKAACRSRFEPPLRAMLDEPALAFRRRCEEVP